MPARAGRSAIAQTKALNRMANILLDLRRRYRRHGHVARSQIVQKGAGVEPMVGHDHRIVVLLRERFRELGDQLVVRLQHDVSSDGWKAVEARNRDNNCLLYTSDAADE